MGTARLLIHIWRLLLKRNMLPYTTSFQPASLPLGRQVPDVRQLLQKQTRLHPAHRGARWKLFRRKYRPKL